jgi:four helix bundle protein
MFDFEKLDVYQTAKKIHLSVQAFLKANPSIDRDTRSQLRRASMSICLNNAEGAGRFTNPDKRHFYVIARGSVFECVAVMDLLQGERAISKEDYDKYYRIYDRLSRMLFGMIGTLTKRNK